MNETTLTAMDDEIYEVLSDNEIFADLFNGALFGGNQKMCIRDSNNAIQPLVMPDAKARNFGGTDWFGIEWEYEPNTKAAMVKPGTQRLSAITKWREELEFPDLSAIDWKKDYEENYKGRIAPDRFSYFVIVNEMCIRDRYHILLQAHRSS